MKLKLWEPRIAISIILLYISFIILFLLIGPMGQFIGKEPLTLTLEGTIGEWIITLIASYFLALLITNKLRRK